jgi:hypothetical protein
MLHSQPLPEVSKKQEKHTSGATCKLGKVIFSPCKLREEKEIHFFLSFVFHDKKREIVCFLFHGLEF